ncbi:MAG: nucleotide exchange factor GrpE [Paludibacteraceae bacterium]|nr:nucleotide exchange factor GrpE [Paludibacteraceae bacterium]
MSKHNKHHHEEEQAQKSTMEVQSETPEAIENEQTGTTATQDNEEKLKELTEKVEALEDTKLRLMAEFENFRRRTNKEKLELMESAGESIFRDMLPLVDDFERAIQAMQKAKETDNDQSSAHSDSLTEGVELIYQKFLAFLQNHNVTPIETDGKDFSTDEHEAITTIDMGKDKQGKIIDCTQKGYKLGDRVIRFSKVVVGA